MKFTAQTLLLVSLAAAFTFAQTYKAPPPFSHIVIIFQENRTPDNLFGAGAGVHATCGSQDSDHPDQNGLTDSGTGPDWVAAIVDAIGSSYKSSGGVCDYWGTSTTAQRNEPTVIFITWDDWGGFYDHVPPPAVYRGNANDQCTTAQQTNGWGCGYVYGFGVPLLVVSEYTPAGTISGKIPSPGAPNFQHDFGSILAFTEKNFTNQGYNLPPIAPTPYTYADQNTLDTGPQKNWTPLWDFLLATSPRPFTYINPISPQHTGSFFESYYQTEQSDGLPTPYGPEYEDED